MIRFFMTKTYFMPGWWNFLKSLEPKKNTNNFSTYEGYTVDFLNQELEPWSGVVLYSSEERDEEYELIVEFTEEGYLAFKLRWE